MQYTSADIFTTIDKVAKRLAAYETREDEDDILRRKSDQLCSALCDLQSVVDVVYRQENFNPELQDAYDIAKFVLVEIERYYGFGVWEANISTPSLRHTSAYTADAIRTFQEGDEREIKTALYKVGILANTLNEGPLGHIHPSEDCRPESEIVNLTSVARFVSYIISELTPESEPTKTEAA